MRKELIKEFVYQYNKYCHENGSPIKKELNKLEDFIDKNSPINGFSSCVFFEELNVAPEGDYFIFAESYDSNYYYLANTEQTFFFCTERDSEFLWHCASSFEMFIQIITIVIEMLNEVSQNGMNDLTDEEYWSYYQRCKEVSEDFEENDEFLKFMCCIVEG